MITSLPLQAESPAADAPRLALLRRQEAELVDSLEHWNRHVERHGPSTEEREARSVLLSDLDALLRLRFALTGRMQDEWSGAVSW